MTTRRDLVRWALAASAVLLVASCWIPDNPIDPNADAYAGEPRLRIATMELSPAWRAVGTVEPVQYSLLVTFEDGSKRDVTAEAVWSTSDASVVQVGNEAGTRGLAIPNGPGSAVVSAEYEGASTDEAGVSGEYYSGTVFVSESTGSDVTGTGMSDTPFATVARGLDVAGALAVSVKSVVIAAGTYTVSTPLAVLDDVSIHGGHDPVTWERDPALHPTRIVSAAAASVDRASADTPLYIGPLAGTSTTISGLTLSAGGTPGGPPGNYRAGLVCEGCRATITECRIDGGQSDGEAYGILLLADAQPVIDGNTIVGDAANNGTLSVAIHSSGSGPDIFANTIDPGSTNPTRSIGLWIGDPGSSSTHVYNNVILGGTGDEAFGVHVTIGTSNHLISNTINGEGRPGRTSAAVVLEGGRAQIRNNLIYTEAGSVRYGIHEAASGSDPTELANNAFFDAPSALYLNSDDPSTATVDDPYVIDLSNQAELNDWTVTTGSSTIDTAANVADTPVFQDAGAGNWRLAPGTPLSITAGGQNSQWISKFPKIDTIGIDFDGVLRDAPWSIGAFEYY